MPRSGLLIRLLPPWVAMCRLISRSSPVVRCATSMLPACFCIALFGASTAQAAPANPRDQALAYIEQGAQSYQAGDLAEAVRRWSNAIQLCQLAGDKPTEVDALARRGEAFGLMGRLRAAEGDLRQALSDALASGDPVQVAAISGALGNIYFQAHDFVSARPLLERSLAIATMAHRETIVAASANNLGNLALASGDVQSAGTYYDRSVSAASASGNAVLQRTALTNKARVLFRQGSENDAVDTLETALRLAADEPGSSDRAYALIAIGRLALQNPARADTESARRQAIAEAAFRQSDALAARLRDPRLSSLAAGYTAELRSSQARPTEAKRLATQAVYFAQQAAAADLLYQWEWLQGRLEREAGHDAVAIQLYRRAITHLQEVRQEIPVDYTDGHSSFREIMGPLYLGLADMLLRTSADAGNRTEQGKLLIEARNTVELLKTAEVRDYFKDQCLVPLEASTSGADRSAASTRTALLYPIMFPDRIELVAAVGEDQQRITVPVTEATATAEAHELRRGLETLGTREFLGASQTMYNWLIRPVLPFLQAHEVDTLVIVPDGALRSIPFAALYDGHDYLVTKYSIATELGLTLMDPKPLGRQPVSALLSGLSAPTQGYPGLPYVRAELSALKDVARSSTVLEDREFSLMRVEAALKTRPYSIVHIASHAKFSSDPAKTFILAYDGPLTLQELEDAVKTRRWDSNPLELLTLSACQTAVGDDRAALGLAGMAIKAGARSAVASLWYINDEAAFRVVTRFYKELQQPGVSKAQALQHAQLVLMQDTRFRHPGYWAPFLIIGNWL
jgi:CHAT domain-containing protein